jgi:peptidoglycan/LPS O-acetylase OafA/YrhL
MSAKLAIGVPIGAIPSPVAGVDRDAAPARAASSARVRWLDGLRGLAAFQVVLLHYACAFLPGLNVLQPNLARYGWEPFVSQTPAFFLLNGYGAVYLFFLLSGTALTIGFASRPFAIVASVLRRFVRLGVPTTGALILGAVLLAILPEAHRAAGGIAGSQNWLGTLMPRHPTVGMLLHQILLEGMPAGYRGFPSQLPDIAQRWLGLVSSDQSFDPPLWTLHLEFCGSLLVIGLVALRAALPRPLHLVLCASIGIALFGHPLEMFLIGHLVTPALLRGERLVRPWPVALASLVAGMVLCGGYFFPMLGDLLEALRPYLLSQSAGLFTFQMMLGELLVFVGLASLPGL